jgi:hypothetical protein
MILAYKGCWNNQNNNGNDCLLHKLDILFLQAENVEPPDSSMPSSGICAAYFSSAN